MKSFIKLFQIATFSQGKQIEINNQYLNADNNRVRFLRIVDYTDKNEPPRYVDNQGKS